MQLLVELPYVLVQSIMYGLIVYSTIGFHWTAAKFMWFFFFMFFTFLYYTYYGMMTVALTPNAPFAAIVSSAFYGIWMLFSGFLIPRTVSSRNALFCCQFFWLVVHCQFPCPLFFFDNQNLHVLFTPENSSVVEMVLLGLPCFMDTLWIGNFTVWKYGYQLENLWR